MIRMIYSPVGKNFLNYDVNDEAILQVYKKATSPLTLVNKPPLVDAGAETAF